MDIGIGDATALAIAFGAVQSTLYVLRLVGEPKLNGWLNGRRKGRGSPLDHEYQLPDETMDILKSTQTHTRRIEAEVCGPGGCATTQDKLSVTLSGVGKALDQISTSQQRIVELMIAHDTRSMQK